MNTVEIVNKPVFRGCLLALQGLLGGNVAVRIQPPPLAGQPNFLLSLNTRPHLRLRGEVKRRLIHRSQILHHLVQKRGASKEIFFAEGIAEPVAEELRKAGVSFVDLQGNAYLWNPPQVMIDIRGKRLAAPIKAEPGRLIEASGLKVCHLLLTDADAAGETLRGIARKANVSLGTAQIVVRELERMGWLQPGESPRRRLVNRKELIDLFIRGYSFKLRPDCWVGRYRHKNNNLNEILKRFESRLGGEKESWALTGGFASRKLLSYLEPDSLAIFVNEEAERNLSVEPMLSDANGNITLLRLFAPTVIEGKRMKKAPLATPILIYAELLHDGRPRELETARMIFEKFIEREGGVGK